MKAVAVGGSLRWSNGLARNRGEQLADLADLLIAAGAGEALVAITRFLATLCNHTVARVPLFGSVIATHCLTSIHRWIKSLCRSIPLQVSFKSRMPGKVELTIGETADATGVAASTLRYWESIGILAASRRMHGQRRYGPDALERVALIEIAKRSGFSLAEIRVLLSGLSERTPPPQVWEQLARRKLPEIERKLVEMQAIKRTLEEGLDCQCVTLQDCLGWASPTAAR